MHSRASVTSIKARGVDPCIAEFGRIKLHMLNRNKRKGKVVPVFN